VHVTVLALGRQLNPNDAFGSTEDILADRRGVRWTARACVLCS